MKIKNILMMGLLLGIICCDQVENVTMTCDGKTCVVKGTYDYTAKSSKARQKTAKCLFYSSDMKKLLCKTEGKCTIQVNQDKCNFTCSCNTTDKNPYYVIQPK